MNDSKSHIDLRTYIFLDSLQSQMASYISTVSRGFLPVGGQSSCIIEIAPGIEINSLTDVAIKATNVKPGLQIVERAFGMLEVHSDDQGDTRVAGESVLTAINQTEENRIRPRILTSQLIKNVDDHHAQLINRNRRGSMLLKGETLYVLEMEPAGYAYYAANEAEKAANIKIIDVIGFGKFGRVYISGDEAEVLECKTIVEKRLAEITGREDY
jgi:ethanolamine utilization microcompartment shell protein EutL